MTDAAIRALARGLARDPELPARDLLLDPAAVHARLPGLLAPDGTLELETCALVRVKYRVGESLRVLYRLGTGGRDRLVTARLFRPGRSRTAYERAVVLEPSPRPGPWRTVCHDPDLEAVWWTFPRDRKLGDLGWLTSPGVSLGRENGVPGWLRTEVVQYVPERSVTVRALDDRAATLAYAKAYAPDAVPPHGAAVRQRHVAEELRRTGEAVSAPSSLAWSDSQRLLLMEGMPGRPWSALSGDRLVRAMGRLGLAVACLHGCTTAGGLPAFGRLRPDRVQRSVDIVGRARPDVARHAGLVAARLRAAVPDAEPSVVLHGDCHPGNALIDGDAVALIDLDQMGHGPAAADLGSLLARLRYAVTVHELGASEAAELEACFLAGYAERRALPAASSLAWHTAAALLVERALRAVNRVNRSGLAGLDELIAAADAALDRGVLP